MDEEARLLSRDEAMDDLGSNGSELEVEREHYDDELLDKKLRESRKHRSKDRKDRGNQDRERSKEREKVDSSKKYLDKHDIREMDRKREMKVSQSMIKIGNMIGTGIGIKKGVETRQERRKRIKGRITTGIESWILRGSMNGVEIAAEVEEGTA